MQIFKMRVEDRNYTKIGVVDAYNLRPQPYPNNLNAVEQKLFNQDIFTSVNGVVNILHSSIRCMEVIPGVIVLNENKTYGKYKKDKLLYKCVPDDKRLPIFLIPYKKKNNFNKNTKNKYVIFKFKNWDGKHPVATAVNTLGDTDQLDNFYEYQLYCKSLYASIQNITKKAMQKLKVKTSDEYISLIKATHTNLKDYRTTRNIYTIDSSTSRDFDDAFDIEIQDDYTRIGIYISNVSFWMDIMDLWDSFSNRISTIYLPDRKRPMLPTVLSDALCSLTENDTRFAFEISFKIDKNFKIIDHEFNNCVINVKENLRYDTTKLENYDVYTHTYETVVKMNKGEQKYVDSITSCHDIIAYLMILMNHVCAKELMKYEVGIYRTAKYNSNFKPPDNIPDNAKKFMKQWNSTGGKYCKFIDKSQHEILRLDNYVHITSPIRRLVDLLNIMSLQEKLGLYQMSESAKTFFEKWTTDDSIEYINVTMRSIRKVQNDCSLLKICFDDASVLEKIYTGFIFDKIIRNDGLYQYMVYLPELNMSNRFTSRHNKENMTNQKFKLFTFIDEINLKNKIRLEIQE